MITLDVVDLEDNYQTSIITEIFKLEVSWGTCRIIGHCCYSRFILNVDILKYYLRVEQWDIPVKAVSLLYWQILWISFQFLLCCLIYILFRLNIYYFYTYISYQFDKIYFHPSINILKTFCENSIIYRVIIPKLIKLTSIWKKMQVNSVWNYLTPHISIYLSIGIQKY